MSHDLILGLLRDWEESGEAEAWMTKSMSVEQRAVFRANRDAHNMGWPRGMAVEVLDTASLLSKLIRNYHIGT